MRACVRACVCVCVYALIIILHISRCCLFTGRIIQGFVVVDVVDVVVVECFELLWLSV